MIKKLSDLIYTFLDNIQRFKEIVDKYSEMFIDLENDVNPQYDADEADNKKKI